MEQKSDPPVRKHRIRTAFLALGLGLLIAATIAAFILLVSNDMRWVLAIGSSAFLLGAFWLGSRRRGGLAGFVLLCLPLLLFHGGLVVPELPGLWPHLAFWLAFALLGWLGFRSGTPAAAAFVVLLLVGSVSAWYGIAYVPGAISRSLTEFRNDPAPEFALDHLDGTPYDVESLQGKVVVMDFFATWCLPCRAELPELEEIRRQFEHRNDVEILVVANDSGGDTPESIRDFVEDRELELEFVYDHDGTAHAAFGFAGLPGLVVIDREGRIRLTREGYNSAESEFGDSLVELVESL